MKSLLQRKKKNVLNSTTYTVFDNLTPLHLLEMTQYHSPMQAATNAPALLPVQMGPNTLELEAQQRGMMQQQMMILSLPADSTNYPPSIVSAGTFQEVHGQALVNLNGMHLPGNSSAGGKFSVSMLDTLLNTRSLQR